MVLLSFMRRRADIQRLRVRSSEGRSGGRRSAFTLIELLAVIGVIAILAGLLLPALSKGKVQALNVACLNHLDQLQVCWHLYAVDNEDLLPPNNFVYSVENTNAFVVRDISWCPGIAPLDTTTSNIEQGVLFPYNRSAAIYRCPADKSTAMTPEGEKLPQPRTRSYNMSQSINGAPVVIDYIPAFAKFTAIDGPQPPALFVFIDVHEEGIWDSLFGIPPPGWNFRDTNGVAVAPTWWDLPADRHNQGCNLSFADGHVEHWKWAAPKIFEKIGQPIANEKDMKDFLRVRAGVRPSPSPALIVITP